MSVHAILFGSIGSVVETSELQRRAFNRAFAETGLDWYWDDRTYARMLQKSGGVQRIADFAADLGETVDAGSVHKAKVAQFSLLLASEGLSLRPGVRDMIDAAKSMGQLVGFVTSTGTDQTEAVFDALGDALRSDEFDYIGEASFVDAGKPAPDIYVHALDQLNIAAANAIAIEDSPVSALAALGAGIDTYGFAGQMHRDAQFPSGVHMIDELDPIKFTRSLIAAE